MKQFVKKAAFTLAFVLTLCSSYSFAAGNDENKEIKSAFRHDFENAQLMSTEAHVNFTKVAFSLNGQIMTAFYSTSGELLAVTRNLTTSQLPVSLLMNYKKHYDGYWVTDLFEVSQHEESGYYLTLENADSRVTLRSNGDSWEVFANARK